MTDQSGQQVTFNGTPTGTPMMGGYQYNGYAPQPKINNYLSEDEIKSLQQNTNMFTLNLTEEEMLRSRCNHRSIDGMSDTLVYDQNTGIARCTICGYEFKPIEPNSTYENIKDSTDNIIDILQTIKLLYTDLPAQAAAEYFPVIGLIEKIPKLFEFATKNFNKHEFEAWTYNNHNMGGIAMLQNLYNTFGSSAQFTAAPQFNGGPVPQYNPYAANMGAPVGTPVAPGVNPFGYYGASQPQPFMNQPVYPNAPQGYAPQTVGYQYNPQAPVAPAAPTAPQAPQAPEAPAADVVVKQQTVSV